MVHYIFLWICWNWLLILQWIFKYKKTFCGFRCAMRCFFVLFVFFFENKQVATKKRWVEGGRGKKNQTPQTNGKIKNFDSIKKKKKTISIFFFQLCYFFLDGTGFFLPTNFRMPLMNSFESTRSSSSLVSAGMSLFFV